MYAQEDRHALLFAPSRSPNAAGPNDAPVVWEATSQDLHLFPERPPASALSEPQGSAAAEPAEEAEATPLLSAHPQPPRHQRRVTLFAAIDMKLPQKGLANQSVCMEPLPLSEQTCIPSQPHPAQRKMPAPFLAASRAGPPFPGFVHNAPSSTYAQRATYEDDGSQRFDTQRMHQPSVELHEQVLAMPLPHRQCCESCSHACSGGTLSKVEDLVHSLKSADAHLGRSGMGSVDARQFVAHELQEINRLIQARALRLRQQEEEAAASAATARNSLRLHAQQLLNKAAEKLERVAAQQRRRAEAAVDEAAAVLRKALEAQRMLRHEKNMLRQLQEQREKEGRLGLIASTEALQAERRRCLALEGRLAAVQQENIQLRALLHAHPPVAYHTDNQTHINTDVPDALSVPRGWQKLPAPRSTAARHTSRFCAARGASQAVPTTSTVERSCSLTFTGARFGAPRRGGLRPGNGNVLSSRMAKAMGQRAVVDVEVRLPSIGPSVASRVLSNEKLISSTEPSSLKGCTEEHQPQQLAHKESLQPDSSLPTEAFHMPNSPQASSAQQRRTQRPTGSSARRTDSSASGNASNSSSRRGVRRRGRRKLRGRTSGQLSRSASHGSISTSTSSNRASTQRRAERRRGRCSSSTSGSIAARHARISFSVPELTRSQQQKDAGASSSGSPTPERTTRGANRRALRGDVAGRLQASLTRLQERQMLQDRIHSLAKQFLQPQRGADLP